MGHRRPLDVASWRRMFVGASLLAICGCAASPTNSFFDQTKVFGIDEYEAGIRRVLSPRDTPLGLAGAEEPTAEDLVATYSDYRLVRGDTLAVTIQDFFGPQNPYSAVHEVNPLGTIRLPELGTVKVVGLTEPEVEEELREQLTESGLMPRPMVTVFVQGKRGRLATVMGGVPAPGPYPIVSPDMRLLEFLGMIGGPTPMARTAYVIRTEAPVVAEGGALPAEETMPAEEGFVVPVPVEEDGVQPASFMTMAGMGRRGQDAPATREADATRAQLDEVMTGTTAAPATRGATEERERPFIFDPATGELFEAEPGDEESRRGDAPAEEEVLEPAEPPTDTYAEPFDWDDAELLGPQQRVIEIDLQKLKAGDPSQNVVVRPRDVIRVPVDTGVFYMMGEVNRPGVYALGGREVTAKQAIAIVGGFSPLAWPQRCELIRREPGTDREVTYRVNLDAIFAGLEDDFYLRDNDILNVGTHFVAPFLFVMRNSFRFTYGFGFVYDRNFADKDAYQAQTNPATLEQFNQSQRGLPF